MDFAIRNFLTQFQYQLAEKVIPEKEKIRKIEEAIQSKSVLKITYLKASDEKSIRQIQPLVLEMMKWKGRSFLGMLAYCYEREEERNFSIKRVLWIEGGE